MKAIFRWVGILSIIAISAAKSQAAIHYVATTGADSGTCSSQDTACLTLNYAISNMSGGDVLEISGGTYSGLENALTKNSNIPKGAPNAYTTIKAANIDETTSNVIIESSFNFVVGAGEASREIEYVEFNGLKVVSNEAKNISGQHVRVFNTGFEGGPAFGNEVSVSIGHNNHNRLSHHILLEDIWVYGAGGRYNVLIYNSEDVIVRRAVIRHDGGWDYIQDGGGNPEAGITIYNAIRVQLQNVIVLDSLNDKSGGYGFTAFYNVSNGSNASNGQQHSDTRITGSMAINNATESGIAWDDSLAILNSSLDNSVIYNSGSSIITNGANKQVTITNVTAFGGEGDGIAVYGNNNVVSISRSIIGFKEGLVNRYANAYDNLCFGNGEGNGDCAISDLDPRESGLLYLPRIENDSFLKTAGADSVQIGAQIINRMGVDHCYYGDVGFDVERSEALWPWPNETKIAQDLCAHRNEGLCLATSLTTYIWELLGNSAPSNLKAMPQVQGVIVREN